MTTVTLTREQRDGLYEFVAGHLEASDLEPLVQARIKDIAAVKALVASLPACIRLLDQIGWDEHGEAPSYEVSLDSEVHRLCLSWRTASRGRSTTTSEATPSAFSVSFVMIATSSMR